MYYFFCRLNPPRPTFAQDMSPEERELMQRHAMYWKALMDQGKVIVFGPVADPHGGWGAAVLQLEHPDEASRHTSGDPVIVAGRGFSYEVLPMPRAVLPG